jgi:hypothetical protein
VLLLLIGLLAFELISVLSPTLLGLYLSSHFTPCGLVRGLSIKVKVAQKKKSRHQFILYSIKVSTKSTINSTQLNQ